MEGAPGQQRAVARIGAQLAAVVVLHFGAAVVIERFGAARLSRLLGVPLPHGGGLGATIAGWAAASSGPIALWALLIVARAVVLRRGDSPFWFIGTAMLVAGITFTIAIAHGVVDDGLDVRSVAAAIAGWLLPGCAALVAGAVHLARRPGERR